MALNYKNHTIERIKQEEREARILRDYIIAKQTRRCSNKIFSHYLPHSSGTSSYTSGTFSGNSSRYSSITGTSYSK